MLIAWHGVTSTPAPLYPNRTEPIPSPIVWEFSWFDTLLWFLAHPSLVPNLIPFSNEFAIHFQFSLLPTLLVSLFCILICFRGARNTSCSSSFALLHFFYNVAVFPFLPSRRHHELYASSPIFVFCVVQNIPNTFYTHSKFMQHMPHVSTSARIITRDAVMTYTIYLRRKPPISNILNW